MRPGLIRVKLTIKVIHLEAIGVRRSIVNWRNNLLSIWSTIFPGLLLNNLLDCIEESSALDRSGHIGLKRHTNLRIFLRQPSEQGGDTL